MHKNRFILVFTLISLMTISSCQAAPAMTEMPAVIEEVQNIQVGKEESSQKSMAFTEDFPLPNCGGTEKLGQTLGAQVSVTKSVQLGTTVSASGGGEVGVSAAAKITVEAAVEAAYQQEYLTANSRLDTIEMGAAPKTHVIYTIYWEKQEFSSVVTYELNKELVQTPYIFTMNVPKISSSREENCSDSNPVTPPIPQPISTKDLNCSPLSHLGKVVEVTYDGTNIAVKNISDFTVSIRISVDYLDPDGTNPDPNISGTGEWVLPGAYFIPNNGFSMNISRHSSAQVWAWDGNFHCVDNFWLNIK